MIEKIDELKKKLKKSALETVELSTDSDIQLFQKRQNIILPNDLILYFKNINGGDNEYDINSYRFYNLQDFKSIKDELIYWNGIPDYSNIVNTLKDFERYYVLADYLFKTFTYAIKLSKFETANNEVIVICGDEYKIIACNFSEFVELYLNSSIKLHL